MTVQYLKVLEDKIKNCSESDLGLYLVLDKARQQAEQLQKAESLLKTNPVLWRAYEDE